MIYYSQIPELGSGGSGGSGAAEYATANDVAGAVYASAESVAAAASKAVAGGGGGNASDVHTGAGRAGGAVVVGGGGGESSAETAFYMNDAHTGNVPGSSIATGANPDGRSTLSRAALASGAYGFEEGAIANEECV
jgi:hypothetical protein